MPHELARAGRCLGGLDPHAGQLGTAATGFTFTTGSNHWQLTMQVPPRTQAVTVEFEHRSGSATLVYQIRKPGALSVTITSGRNHYLGRPDHRSKNSLSPNYAG